MLYRLSTVSNGNRQLPDKGAIPCSDQVTLRRENTGDLAFCEALFIETHQTPLLLAGLDEVQRNLLLQPQFSNREQGFAGRFPQADFRIIVVDRLDCGRLIVDRQQDRIHLVDIVISQMHRNLGYGNRLLGNLCDEADREQKILSLTVAVDNPAFNLYRRLGFEPTLEQDFYIGMERQPAPIQNNQHRGNRS